MALSINILSFLTLWNFCSFSRTATYGIYVFTDMEMGELELSELVCHAFRRKIFYTNLPGAKNLNCEVDTDHVSIGEKPSNKMQHQNQHQGIGRRDVSTI